MSSLAVAGIVAGIVAVGSVAQAMVVVTRALLVDQGRHGRFVGRSTVAHRTFAVPELVAAEHRVRASLASPLAARELVYPALVDLASRAPTSVRVEPPPDRIALLAPWLDRQLTQLDEAFGTWPR